MAIALLRPVILRSAGWLIVWCVFAWSQQRRGEVLTLEHALTLAERFNPQLRAVSAVVDGAQAGIVTARQRPNPFFDANFGGQQGLDISNPTGQLGVYGFTQPLELNSVRRARIRTAELGRQSTQFALSEARLSLRAAVKQAFYEVLRREAEVELAEGNLKLIDDLRRRIAVQVQVGEAARLELIRADAELAAARIQVRSSELRLATSFAGLRAAIGAPLGDIAPEGVLAEKANLPPLSTLREKVLAKHPAVGQAQAEIRRADSRLDLERELRKPQPTLRSELEQQPGARQFRLGLNVPIPAWNRREGEIAEAAAALRQANALAEVRRLEIGAALERAYGVYEVANEQLAAFEAGAMREAEAALEAAEAAFRFGERGIIEVLDAQRVLRGVRQDFLSAQFDRQAALIELERLQAVDLGGR
jgi:cobalt-zinc-cadmium efflux system outer membrane protein